MVFYVNFRHTISNSVLPCYVTRYCKILTVPATNHGTSRTAFTMLCSLSMAAESLFCTATDFCLPRGSGRGDETPPGRKPSRDDRCVTVCNIFKELYVEPASIWDHTSFLCTVSTPRSVTTHLHTWVFLFRLARPHSPLVFASPTSHPLANLYAASLNFDIWHLSRNP